MFDIRIAMGVQQERPLSGSPHGESELRYNGLAHWGLTPFPWEKWDGSCEGITALYQR